MGYPISRDYLATQFVNYDKLILQPRFKTLTDSADAKVPIQQTVADAGKLLVVGADGNVTLQATTDATTIGKEPINGTALQAAIGALDCAEVGGGARQYIASVKQVDGVLAATAATLPTTIDGYGITDAVYTKQLGAASTNAVIGIATLNENGKVPSSQLPAYVDDVLEYQQKDNFPKTGESGKIYLDIDKNLSYRWSGSTYVEISPSLALGETNSTAYSGEKGKSLTDAFNKHETNTIAHIKTEERDAWNNKVDKVTGKGLSTNDYTTAEKNKLASIAEGANKTTVDSALSSTSTNPVQNKVINTALAGKADSSHTHTKSQITDMPTTMANPNALTVKLNGGTTEGTNLFTYTGSAAKSVNITPSAIGAIANNPATVGGTAGTTGYVAFAQLVIKGTYTDRPIEFELISRSKTTPCYVSIRFANGNTSDPTLASLKYYGTDYGVFAVKSTTSTWLLYHTKLDGYDSVTVSKVAASTKDQNITITYPGTFITTKPTSNVTNASLGFNVNYAASATTASKLSNTTAIGSATQPVYFNASGQPVATTYTLAASVPSGAKFTDTTYSVATQSAQGLMSAADKKKLDGIAAGATKITVDSALSSSSTNPVANKAVNTALGTKANKANITGGTFYSTVVNTQGIVTGGDTGLTIPTTAPATVKAGSMWISA